MARIIFIIFALFLLVYMILPGPSSINNFPALPNSVKSTLEGDTIQVPNVAGYFSNNYRDFVTNYYKQSYKNLTWLPFPPVILNYPPEFAYTAIKDQTQSTYLEEYVYPLRDSVFVNGFEPYDQDGNPRYEGAIKFDIGPILYDTKATLRYYPSPIYIRILIWIGILISIFSLWTVGKRIILDD